MGLTVNGNPLPYGKWYSATDNQVQKAIDKRIKDGTIGQNFKYYNVLDYGAVGDGSTNDTKAIRDCIASLPEKNFVLVFPAGHTFIQKGSTTRYPIVPNPDMEFGTSYGGEVEIGEECFFDFENKSNFKIIANGSKIVAHPDNAPTVRNRGFSFLNCHNFSVDGLYYDGNISARRPDGADPGRYNRQSGLSVRECTEGVFNNCIMTGCCMDGIGVGMGSHNILFNSCECTYNYRQGVTVFAGNGITFLNCLFAHTARAQDSNGNKIGTDPRAGIDLESGDEEDSLNIGCLFLGCRIEENEGHMVSFSTGARSTTFNHCFFRTPLDTEHAHYININDGHDSNLIDCYIDGRGIAGFEVKTPCIIERCMFKNMSYMRFGTWPGRTYHEGISAPQKCENNVFQWDWAEPGENDRHEVEYVNIGHTIQFDNPDVIFNRNTIINATSANMCWCHEDKKILEFRDNRFITSHAIPDALKNKGVKYMGGYKVNAEIIENTHFIGEYDPVNRYGR